MEEKIARGRRRLCNPSSLPVIDSHSDIFFESSVSKCGDNADWDWGLYQDTNGEWVLMEADGPGCIFNFTQHRFLSSDEPIFRFYFDNSDVPQFVVKPEDFGYSKPLANPASGAFIGPEDNGNGPIRVVRSFFPLEFKTHCRVTSSLKLEGGCKKFNQGGWGNISYQLYDSSNGLDGFSTEELPVAAYDVGTNPLLKADKIFQKAELKLPSKKATEIFSDKGRGTICAFALEIKKFQPWMLQNIWITISFDEVKEAVSAPFGTFFGCEYGKLPAHLATHFLVADFSGENGFFSNRFPMPFFRKVTITLENRGEEMVELKNISISENCHLKYDEASTGYFSSSQYLPLSPNVIGSNSLIADVRGSGQMVYGVIYGRDIRFGCEGDVRVFVDDLHSPSVQTDGTESWGSYGWGFVCPPQCNPFSAYNGLPNSNSTWSELRLTIGDAYSFRSHLRFELEHGCTNDGGGFHGGQIFMYLRKEPSEVFLLETAPGDGNYSTDGVTEIVTGRFENGIHYNYHQFKCIREMTYSRFNVSIPEENDGLVLKRIAVQDRGRMSALVFIDGVMLTCRHWLFPDKNTIYCLLEDSFCIPAEYTSGKTSITVEIRPLDQNWSECTYKVFALVPPIKQK